MYLRKLSIFFLAFCVIFTAAGCRLINPTGSSSSDDSVVGTASLSVIPTLPSAGGASIRAQTLESEESVRAQALSARIAVKGATVEVRIAGDDEWYPLTEDDGVYSSDDLPNQLSNGYFIRVIKDDLRLYNAVTSREHASGDVEVTERTTLDTLATLEALNRDGDFEIDEILDAAENIDDIKADVVRELDANETLVNNFTAKFEVDGEDKIGEINTDNAHSDAKDDIKTLVESVSTAVVNHERVVLRRSRRFVDYIIYLKSNKTITDLRSRITEDEIEDFRDRRLSEDFIYNAETREELMTVEDDFVSFDFDRMVSEKISDDLYLVGVVGELEFKNGLKLEIDSMERGLVPEDNTFAEFSCKQIRPGVLPAFYVEKIDNSWKIIGNGLRIEEIDFYLAKSYDADEEKASSLMVLEIEGRDITAVTISGDRITGTVDLVEVDGTWETEENPYSESSWTPTTHQAGDEFVLTITDSKGTQEITFTVPSNTDIIEFEDGDIDFEVSANNWSVEWPESELSDFAQYHIFGVSTGEVEKDIFDKSDTSTNVNYPTQLSQGMHVGFVELGARGFGRAYTESLDTSDIDSDDDSADANIRKLEKIADSVSKGLGASAGAAGGAISATSAIGGGNGGSIRASVVVDPDTGFPAGTKFVATFTDWPEDSTFEDALTNVFSMPIMEESLIVLLTRLYHDGEEAKYIANPHYPHHGPEYVMDPQEEFTHMSVWAVVEFEDEDLDALIKMDLGYGIATTTAELNIQEFTFEHVRGTIEVEIDETKYIAEMKEGGHCTVTDKGEVFEIAGEIPEGSVIESFTIDGEEVTLGVMYFGKEGITHGDADSEGVKVFVGGEHMYNIDADESGELVVNPVD